MFDILGLATALNKSVKFAKIRTDGWVFLRTRKHAQHLRMWCRNCINMQTYAYIVYIYI